MLPKFDIYVQSALISTTVQTRGKNNKKLYLFFDGDPRGPLALIF
jgi:hypothetical protein